MGSMDSKAKHQMKKAKEIIRWQKQKILRLRDALRYVEREIEAAREVMAQFLEVRDKLQALKRVGSVVWVPKDPNGAQA